jgi:hypothetical protein
LFAVLAHGMAAVAFWRTGLLVKMLGMRIRLGGANQLKVEEEI